MSDQAIMDKLKKFTVKDLREAVGKKNKKYKDANPYTGYSTAKKEDLIKMIMANKNDFKDMVKIKEPITVESIKKKEEKKAVKKSVDKQETKKAEPIKKPVTKTAKKGDVQGVTSKKESNEKIEDKIDEFGEKYNDIEDEDFQENKEEFQDLFKNVVEYLKKNKSKMSKEQIKSLMSIIKEIKDKKSVNKQETKKAEPIKKPITKTAQKADVQGVTSKKELNGKIKNLNDFMDKVKKIIKDAEIKDSKIDDKQEGVKLEDEIRLKMNKLEEQLINLDLPINYKNIRKKVEQMFKDADLYYVQYFSILDEEEFDQKRFEDAKILKKINPNKQIWMDRYKLQELISRARYASKSEKVEKKKKAMDFMKELLKNKVKVPPLNNTKKYDILGTNFDKLYKKIITNDNIPNNTNEDWPSPLTIKKL